MRTLKRIKVFRVLAWLLACSLACMVARPGFAQNAAPRQIVVEKSIYVPFEKLESVFEKEGRGIFLPYEEFVKLWEAGQPKPPAPKPDLPPADAVIRGGLYTGTVSGDAARFTVTLDIEALKQGWSELSLPFRGVALESAELSNPRALFSVKPANGGSAPPAGQAAQASPRAAHPATIAPEYAVFLPEPGRVQAKLQFSVRVAQEPGKKTIAFGIPPTAVSRIEVSIPEEDVRVEVLPAVAVKQSKAVEKSTQVVAFLGNSSEVAVSWMPPAGKVAEGGAVVFAEQSVRVYLGERILKLSTVVAYQVLRGETDTLRVRAPENTRLLSVRGENIREWTQEGDVVVVRLHAALKAATYQLALGFERILETLPPSLAVPFPRAEEVIRESGWVVLGHEAGLNVRVARTQGLSQADRDEVPEALREGLGVGFRYLAHPLALDLEVEKILPVIRSVTTSVITLGREEDAWVGWIDYSIAKAGVFRFEIRVPSRWSVASIGDPGAVEDFQSADSNGIRTIAVSLKSKALGAFRLPFKLTAEGSAASGEVTHSPPVVVASIEDRGLFGISAPRAFDASTVSREKMLPADVDELFRSGILPQIAAGSSIPLAYAYRELPASVKVKLEAKKTEIEVLVQHLVEISDGEVKLTHVLDHEILYAAVDRLAFSAPSILDNLIKVEAKEKKEVRKGAAAQGRTTWEVVLQAPALGVVSVTITHGMDLKALEPESAFAYEVPIVHAQEAREKGFIAIRKEGTLDIVPQARGLEPIDAGDLPDKLRRGQIYGAFRYFQEDPRLTLALTRYKFQPLATAVVNLVRVESVLSEEMKLRTRATLIVQNTDRQYLELDLPPERIISLAVAGKVQQPRKRKDAAGTLIQVPSSAGPSGAFPVVVVYEEALGQGGLDAAGGASLHTLAVLEGIPVSKVELDLYLPPGYAYLAWRGSLKPVNPGAPALWSRFKSFVNDAVGGATAAGVVAAAAPASPPLPAAVGVTLDLPTRGMSLHRFETLSPVGTLSFVYLESTLHRLADFLAFVLALTAGWLLVAKARWTFFRLGVVFIFLPLALTWFTTGPITEVSTSLLAGGVGALLLTGAARVRTALRHRRSEKLALAPDPFLEEASPGKATGQTKGGGTEGGKEDNADASHA